MGGERYVATNLTKDYCGTTESRLARWERERLLDLLRPLRQDHAGYVPPRNLPKIQRNGS